MSDLIERKDAIEALYKYSFVTKEIIEREIMSIPTADRPQGDVDAVAIFEHEMHNLEQGYITIGEFDKRIEPLRHLCYGRPQGWIPCSERLPSEQGQYLVTFPLCNGEPWVHVLSFNKGKFYETDDEWGDVEYDDVTAWMPLPKPWKGADDE